MRITEEMMGQLLPQNIIDSEELSLASKKVLAAMLDWYKNSQANQTHIVIISNKILCAISRVGGNSLQEALRELSSYNLVTRTIGTKLGDASKYIIHFQNLIKPLKKMTFEEMFSKELESLENPISTIVKNSIVKSSKVENIIEESSKEKKSEEDTSKAKANNYFNEFTQIVNRTLVGKNEDELIQRKVEISEELESKRMELGSSVISRCNLYLKRKFEEALVLV